MKVHKDKRFFFRDLNINTRDKPAGRCPQPRCEGCRTERVPVLSHRASTAPVDLIDTSDSLQSINITKLLERARHQSRTFREFHQTVVHPAVSVHDVHFSRTVDENLSRLVKLDGTERGSGFPRRSQHLKQLPWRGILFHSVSVRPWEHEQTVQLSSADHRWRSNSKRRKITPTRPHISDPHRRLSWCISQKNPMRHFQGAGVPRLYEVSIRAEHQHFRHILSSLHE